MSGNVGRKRVHKVPAPKNNPSSSRRNGRGTASGKVGKTPRTLRAHTAHNVREVRTAYGDRPWRPRPEASRGTRGLRKTGERLYVTSRKSRRAGLGDSSQASMPRASRRQQQLMKDALRDETRTAEEINEGTTFPGEVSYKRYGRGPGRKVDLPQGPAASMLAGEPLSDDSVVMTDPPTETEAKRDFKQGVFDQIDTMVDGIAKVASYESPEGYACDVIQFVKTSTEVPNLTAGDAPNEYIWGAYVSRRLSNCAYQITGSTRASGDLSFTWTAKVAQDDTDTTVPGYTEFSTIYSSFRTLGTQIIVRPLGNDNQNQGICFGGRVARAVDQLSTYWNTEKALLENGQMQTTSMKEQFSIFTTPSDIEDMKFKVPWSTDSADGCLAVCMELDSAQKLSVRKVWTVLAMRKKNYMLGLDQRSLGNFFPHEFNGRMETRLSKREQRYYVEFRKELARSFGLEGEVFLSRAHHKQLAVALSAHGTEFLYGSDEKLPKVRLLTAPAAAIEARSSEDTEAVVGPKQYADVSLDELLKMAQIVQIRMMNDWVDGLKGTKGLGGFLGTLASMVSPATVKAAADIAQQLPIIKDVAAPVNKVLKDKTGKGLSDLAETGWKWAKDGDL